MLTLEEGLAIVEQILPQGCLNKAQKIIFRSSWGGQSYHEIARAFDYDYGYIKDTGSKLWQLLTEILGEKVTKLNFKGVLQRYVKLKTGNEGFSSFLARKTLITRPKIQNSLVARELKLLDQDLTQEWLAEIEGLRQQLAELQNARNEAWESAEKWRKLYNTESEQRRTDNQLAQQAIASLNEHLQKIKGIDEETQFDCY